MGKCCVNLGQNPTGEIMIASGRKMLPVCLLGIVAENRVLHHDHGYALCFKALPDFGDVSRPLVFNTLSLVVPAGLKNDNRGVRRHRCVKPPEHPSRRLPVDPGVDHLHLKALLREKVLKLCGIVLAAADALTEGVACAKGYNYLVGCKTGRGNCTSSKWPMPQEASG